jgi:hypothetical protein
MLQWPRVPAITDLRCRYLCVCVGVDTVKDIPARRLPDCLGFVVIAGPGRRARPPECLGSTGCDPVL